MSHTLDYSALTLPVTKADIDTYKRSYNKKPFLPKSLMILLATAFIMAAILMLLVVVRSLGSTNFGPFIAVVGIMAFIAERSRRRLLARNAMLYKFATSNNLSLRKDVSNPMYAGMIFDNGHSRRIDEALLFSGGTEIGNYIYVTGSGKNQRTYTWGYAKVKLARKLPHMVLDAKGNNFWKFSNLSDIFDRSQVLALEGDFNNYFTLYAPKQYERDAFYVFTPDVMAAMVDHGREYDIEIVDDELFIYGSKHFKLDQPQFYEHMLAIINAIGSKLLDQTDYYADERIGNRTANIVAPEGQRLKSGFNWMIVVIIAAMVYLYVIQPMLLQLIRSL